MNRILTGQERCDAFRNTILSFTILRFILFRTPLGPAVLTLPRTKKGAIFASRKPPQIVANRCRFSSLLLNSAGGIRIPSHTMASNPQDNALTPAKKLTGTSLARWLIQRVNPHWKIKRIAEKLELLSGDVETGSLDRSKKPLRKKKVPWFVVQRIYTGKEPQKRIYFEELAKTLTRLLTDDPNYRASVKEADLVEIHLEQLGAPAFDFAATEGRGSNTSQIVESPILSETSVPPRSQYHLFNVPHPGEHFQSRRELAQSREFIANDFRLHEPAKYVFFGAHRSGKKTLVRQLAWEFRELFPEGALELPLSNADGGSIPRLDTLKALIHHFSQGQARFETSEQLMGETLVKLLRTHRALIILTDASTRQDWAFFARYIPCSLLFTTSRDIFASDGNEDTDIELARHDYGRFKVSSASPEASVNLARSILGHVVGLAGLFASIGDRYGHQLWAIDEVCTTIKIEAGTSIELINRLWSWSHLNLLPWSRDRFNCCYSAQSPDVQKLWRSVSVFHSTFSSDAARSVLESESELVKKAPQILSRLVEAGWIGHFGKGAVFQVPPEDRLFLENKLSETERTEVRRRHAIYISSLARAFAQIDKTRELHGARYKLANALHGSDVVAACLWLLECDSELALELFANGYLLLGPEQAELVSRRCFSVATKCKNEYVAALAAFALASAMEDLVREPRAILKVWEKGYATLSRSISDDKHKQLFYRLQFGLGKCLKSCGFAARAKGIMKEICPGETKAIEPQSHNALLDEYHSHPGRTNEVSFYRSDDWPWCDYDRW